MQSHFGIYLEIYANDVRIASVETQWRPIVNESRLGKYL